MKPRRLKPLDPNTVVLLRHIGWGVLVLGVVALLLAGIWHGTRISALTITEVVASGGETIDPSVVEAAVATELEGAYLGFVPRRFAWLYPAEDVYQAVDAIQRVHNIQVARDGGTSLLVTYDEYVPQALWCTKGEHESCLFVDATGFAFAPAPPLTGGSFLRFVTLGRDAVVEETVLPPDTLAAMHELVRLLAAEGWYVQVVEVDEMGDAFLQVSGGGELKVVVNDEPARIVDNLLTILTSTEFQHLAPGNFAYIDLRFGNKVFVNEELAAPELKVASSTTTPGESQ